MVVLSTFNWVLDSDSDFLLDFRAYGFEIWDLDFGSGTWMLDFGHGFGTWISDGGIWNLENMYTYKRNGPKYKQYKYEIHKIATRNT